MAESGLDLRAVQETLDWHDAPPEVGEVVHMSTEHELAITQLRALLVHCRALRDELSLARQALEILVDIWKQDFGGHGLPNLAQHRIDSAAVVLRGAQDPEGGP